jgi:hypothetical protein
MGRIGSQAMDLSHHDGWDVAWESTISLRGFVRTPVLTVR